MPKRENENSQMRREDHEAMESSSSRHGGGGTGSGGDDEIGGGFERADQDQLCKRRIVSARRPPSSVGDNTNNNGAGGGADPTPQKSAFSGFSFGVPPAASTPALFSCTTPANNNNTNNNKNSELCQKYQTLAHGLEDLFLDQVTPSKSTELVASTKDEELRDTSAGTTATTTTTTSNDYELAKELHAQWENEQMLGTRTGRATLLVTKLIQVFQETLQEHVANHEEEHNVNTNPPESIHDIATRHKVNLVAYDDMVFLAEKLLDCQQEFASANTSSNANNNTKGSTGTHVALAYHYTNQQNLQSIRQNGLMSHTERQQRKISQTKHTAFFGEGIYVANNPFFFGMHGDTGLLVATLPGNSFRVPNHNHTNNGQQQRPTVSSDANSVIGNRHWKGHAIANELVLRTSRQVLPILQFSKELVDLTTNNHHHLNNTNDETDNDDDSTTPAQQGAELLWQFHVKMQKVLDEFMNDNQPTRPVSIFLSEYEKLWVMGFHKLYDAQKQTAPLVKQAAIGAFRTLAQHHPGLTHDKSNSKHLTKILFTCLANPHAPVAPHMVQDFESKGVPKDRLSAALLAGQKHLNELVSRARLQNPHDVIRAAPAIDPAVPTATGLPATTTTTTKRTTESLLDFSSVSTILNAMKGRPDLHEWGCSRLHDVLAGWEKHFPGEDAGEAFLKNGAIDAILNAIFRIPNATVTSGGQGPDRLGSAPAPAPNPAPAPKASSFNFGQAPAPAPASTGGWTAATIQAGSVGTAATIREACQCILILASKSPGIRSNLLKKGAVTFLGVALQKQWPKDTIDVHGHCQQALLAVLGSPM